MRSVEQRLRECGVRNAEQPYGVRSAERGTRNGFTPLHFAHKENIYDIKGILARTKNELTRIKRASLDEIRTKRNPSDGSLLGVNDRGGILSFVK